MNLGIVTTIHSGYGKYLSAWTDSVSQLDPPATKVTISLGPNHGVTPADLKRCHQLLPHLTVTRQDSPVLGTLRNAAILRTKTEWVMVLDVDDLILPDAVEKFNTVEGDADVILLSWIERRSGKPDRIRHQLSPEEITRTQGGRGFFNNSLPFRRSFWKKHHYADNQYPQYQFVADLVEAGARFVKVDEPCDIHLRRPTSFSAKTLGRFNTKKVAYSLRDDAARRLRAHYLE